MKSPLDGRPRTQEMTDKDGRLSAFRVRPRELTPFGVKLADAITNILGVGMLVANVAALPDWRHPSLPKMAFVIGGTIASFWCLHWISRASFRVTTRIDLDLESIRVRRLWGWKRFDRRLEHRFVLLPHDGTERERRRNELATREAAANGKVVQKPIYYGDSFHVVLVYAGHRVDLLSVYGRKQAASIVARLQYCDQLLEQEAKRVGARTNPHVGAEWHDSPGGI
ncbi:hypothetical protein GUY40_27115 [Pseudomonas sp. R5(2019)]|nr:hypothetical protein [Pseudomonas sp. R5(2019)]